MLSRHSGWLIATLVAVGVLMLGGLVWASPPASAPGAPFMAGNADTVDGFHAVSSKAAKSVRANKLLAVGSSGKFPMGVLPRGKLDNRYVNEKGGKYIDIPVQGHAWVAEMPANLSLWKPMGHGTQVKRTAAGSEWFHIAIPAPSQMHGYWADVTYVEFCYSTTNTATYVNRMDLWSDDSRIVAKNLSAPSDTGYHCYSRAFSPPKWFEAVGLSVRGTFASNTHQITLGKAWARVKMR